MDMIQIDAFFAGLFGVSSFILLAIVLRGFFLWYSRIDEVVGLLHRIEDNTRILDLGRTLDLKKKKRRTFGQKARTLVLKRFGSIPDSGISSA